MDDYIEVTAKICYPYVNMDSDENGCSDVTLKYPKPEISKLQASVVSDNPPLGKFDMNILGAGLGLVLIFYVLGYGLGRLIKMVNL
ncbi:hypothetical protein LGZ99_12435 [Photorhabdus temperata]|uniref:Uncharacterized protein n=1 Tax=Photorhabdus temperata subsp. temperata Meg1 TaxID=1393735 RepID=A0A081RV90_PHOTE|nr:hypothetical protein [Photorhabdus temperata]KER02593.1 hypothetical protein MEG1DRAFT_02737 [Photorhabdus temperata subsp. temperata Meg1]MCT8347988.1 hypothetical protein [Photorhabdus temperata]